MKKHCTRIASLALVLALLISTAIPAFAASATWEDQPGGSGTAEAPYAFTPPPGC